MTENHEDLIREAALSILRTHNELMEREPDTEAVKYLQELEAQNLAPLVARAFLELEKENRKLREVLDHIEKSARWSARMFPKPTCIADEDPRLLYVAQVARETLEREDGEEEDA
jgi:hypothetical protein